MKKSSKGKNHVSIIIKLDLLNTSLRNDKLIAGGE